MMHKTVFTIGDLPKAYVGYTSSDGGITPYFELAEALRVMADNNDIADALISYNGETDTFHIAETEYTSESIWKGEKYETEEGIKHLYGIGDSDWMWHKATDEDCHCLAEVVENLICELDTYGYRDVGIDRDEMVKIIHTQLKEPNTFRKVYEIWHHELLDVDGKFDALCNCIRG